jgi:hypothetical protein
VNFILNCLALTLLTVGPGYDFGVLRDEDQAMRASEKKKGKNLYFCVFSDEEQQEPKQ